MGLLLKLLGGLDFPDVPVVDAALAQVTGDVFLETAHGSSYLAQSWGVILRTAFLTKWAAVMGPVFLRKM